MLYGFWSQTYNLMDYSVFIRSVRDEGVFVLPDTMGTSQPT